MTDDTEGSAAKPSDEAARTGSDPDSPWRPDADVECESGAPASFDPEDAPTRRAIVEPAQIVEPPTMSAAVDAALPAVAVDTAGVLRDGGRGVVSCRVCLNRTGPAMQHRARGDAVTVPT